MPRKSAHQRGQPTSLRACRRFRTPPADPCASLITMVLEPGRARSTGLWPVLGTPFIAPARGALSDSPPCTPKKSSARRVSRLASSASVAVLCQTLRCSPAPPSSWSSQTRTSGSSCGRTLPRNPGGTRRTLCAQHLRPSGRAAARVMQAAVGPPAVAAQSLLAPRPRRSHVSLTLPVTHTHHHITTGIPTCPLLGVSFVTIWTRLSAPLIK